MNKKHGKTKKFVFGLLFGSLFFLNFFASSQKQWYDIPNTDDALFLNRENSVSNFEEAKTKCAEIKSIPLALWDIRVVDFVGNLVFDLEG